MRIRRTFRVFLICLALGIAFPRFLTWISSYLSDVHVTLPTASSDVLVVTTKLPFSGFILIGHACGGRTEDGGEGYTTGYQSNGMVPVSTSGIGYGTRRKAARALDRLIDGASEVISDTRTATDPSSMTRRVELKFESEGETSYTIVKYDGGPSLETIDSRSLETAREFELWDTVRTGWSASM